MAKAKKLPSGSWRVQIYAGTDQNGKKIRKSFTATTKKEAEFMALNFQVHNKDVRKNPANMTLSEAIDKYIELKENILSPSTIAGYLKIKRNYFRALMPVKLQAIDNRKLQQAVNDESKRLAEKTVRNAYGLVKSVMMEYAPDISLDCKLPQRQKYNAAFLTPQQIPVLINEIKGSKAELAILLALWLGLRWSEIMALTWDCYDPKRRKLTIKAAAVLDKERKLVIKTTKTTASTRILSVPPYIADMLAATPQTSNRIVTVTTSTARRCLNSACENTGLPHLRIHDLRHTSASIDLLLGTPERYAMERGGWSNARTMNKIYQHTFQDAREQAEQNYNDYIQKLIDNGK